MHTQDCVVVRDDDGLFEMMARATKDALTYYPEWDILPKNKAKEFVRDYPEHSECPRSLLRGIFRFGVPRLSDTSSFLWRRGGILRIKRKGDIHLQLPCRVFTPPRNYEFDFENGIVRIFLYGRPPMPAFDRKADRPAGNVGTLRRTDNTLDFLIVSEGYHDESTWRKKRLIDYVHKNPHILRQELRRNGFRGDTNMDLLGDSLEGMQLWLRSRQKPPECNILSSSQIASRQDREFRMPDVINEDEASAGNLARQSYDAQHYEAMHRDRHTDFFS